ncbi:MAG: hypothetical protein KBT20_03180 [Bacteroidales bacterium]|nr:hypothetical protein [Candidatus Liminaster caballi]
MKKKIATILITFCSVLLGIATKAQDLSNYNYDLSISYGYKTHESVSIDGKVSWPGAINVQYMYPITEKWSMGASAVYGMSTYTVDFGYGYSDEFHDYYYSFMPAFRYYHLNKENIALYSKAALGFSNQIKNSSSYDDKNNGMSFAFQVSVIGIEFGIPLVRGFIEGGYGSQGIVQAGLKVCL